MQAVVAHQAGRLSEAEGIYRQVLALDARYPPAMHLLGMIAGETGRTTLAIKLLREVVSLDPQSIDARNQLAILLRTEGRTTEAIHQCQRAIRLKPEDAGTHNNLGVTYLAERRFAEAAASFERAIALKRDLGIYHQHLGDALRLQSRDSEAAASYRTAVALTPNLAEVHVRLGQLALLDGDYDEANACFRRATVSEPASMQGRVQLARLFAEAGRFAEAEDGLRRAIDLDPNADDARQMLGEILQQLGRFDEAIANFEQAIALKPTRTSFYLGIASSKKFTETDRPLVKRMTALLAEGNPADQDRANLHYCLGRAGDDLADYENAMRHFDEANRIAANRLRLSGRSIDRKLHAENIDRLIASFTGDFFARHAALGSQSESAILILGMIRSGTTLVEQIASSHPEVGAAGELRFWGDRGTMIGDAAIGVLDSAAVGCLAKSYCRLLHGLVPGVRRIIDKMPTNFLLLGLIHLALPRARIIHCRRNPVDNCLSIYFTPYSRSPDYAHERKNIAFYYEQYSRLMAHWRRVLPPDRFLDVDYEDLVRDRERVTRQIIGFCGLEWNDACLQSERNARVIKTPSLWQARQPVFTSSVARWRHYEPWLGEFRRLLTHDGD